MKLPHVIYNKISTEYIGEICSIDQVCCIGPVINPVANDEYNTDIANIIHNQLELFTEENQIILSDDLCATYEIGNIEKLGQRDYYTVKPDERIFIIVNIKCDRRRDVIINFGIGHLLKVWINEQFISSGLIYPNCFTATSLAEGDNILFIESKSVYTGSVLQIRMNEYFDETFGVESSIAGSVKTKLLNDGCIITRENSHITSDKTYDFMIVPKDRIDITDKTSAMICIYDDRKQKIDSFQSLIRQRICYDVSLLKEIESSYFTFTVSISSVPGNEYLLVHNVLKSALQDEYSKLKTQYESFKTRYTLTAEDSINIDRRFYNIERISNGTPPAMITEDDLRDKPVVNEIIEIQKIFSAIRQGEHFKDLIIRNEINHVYFRSKLDDHIEMYSISIPSGYSDDTRYPMIIFIPVCSPDAYWHHVRPLVDDKVILVDVSLRGFTLASYIGEAAFLEVFNILLDRYNIDPRRIYLIGYSNGGYAALSLTQHYPHLFTAIVAIGGSIYTPNACNLSNVNILNVVAELDDQHILDATKKMAEILSPFEKYQEYFVKNSGHNNIWIGLYSKYIMDWLLEQEKQDYPIHIHFRTERIRHRKNHWIEVTEIEKGKTFCEIDATISNDFHYALATKNVEQLVLSLPDYWSNQKIEVFINSTQVYSGVPGENKVTFTKTNDTYQPEKYSPLHSVPETSQGMGILDIYMDRLKIVVPSITSPPDNKDRILEIAAGFAQPYTQGAYPVVRVNYPIIDDCQVTEDDIKRSNLMLFGMPRNNRLLSMIQEHTPFTVNEDGFEYKETSFKGDYLLIFIAPNPLNSLKKILIICTNNDNLYQKNMITRKVNLPTFYSGFYPLMNNEAILFDGKRYSVIYRLGDDWEHLTFDSVRKNQ